MGDDDEQLLEPFGAVIGAWATEATHPAVDTPCVRRTYQASLRDGVLRCWRDASGFDQRFSATIGRDGVDGLWQLARTPGDWQDDLTTTYRRSGPRR